MKIFNSYDLKIFAILTMVIDHIGVIFFPNDIIFRIIGRASFIIFAFLLVEGAIHTRNIHRYFFKLLIWAMLSEIPFDFAIYGEFFYWERQNVFWTLAIGIGSISLFYKLSSIYLKMIVALLGLGLSIFIRADYSWYGLLMIYIFFFLRGNLWSVVGVGVLNILLLGVQTFGFLGLFPILFYSGEQERKTGLLFYSFYAVHLILLVLLKIFFSFII